MSQYLVQPGAEVHFHTEGLSGPWVTFINGHTRAMTDFKLMSKHFVEAGYRCLLIDNRGAGLTKTTREFSLEDFRNDVLAVIDHLQIPRTNVLGISMGGVIAQHAAAHRPQVINKLVLVSTTCDDRFVKLDHSPWGDNVEDVVKRLQHYFTEDFHHNNRLLVEAMAKQTANAVKHAQFDEKSKAQRQAIKTYTTRGILGQIAAPTLIIHGERDEIISVDAAHALHEGIKGSTLKLFEGAGHLLLAERSRQLTQAVLDFLA